jgi:hypothetical protein
MTSSKLNVFNVHGKTLELANYEERTDRSSAYQINKGEIKNRDQLLDYCQFLQPLADTIYSLSHDLFDDKQAEDSSYEYLEEFLERLDDNELKTLLKEVDDWLGAEMDIGDFEYEDIPTKEPISGYKYAFNLFEGNTKNVSLYNHVEFDVFEAADALNIYVVEGDHPGSSYLGAELGIPVEKANEIAKEKGFPLKFVKIS